MSLKHTLTLKSHFAWFRFADDTSKSHEKPCCATFKQKSYRNVDQRASLRRDVEKASLP